MAQAVTTGERIRALRESLGMKQAEFADALGTTSVMVSRWENGHVEPRRMSRHALNQLAVEHTGEPLFPAAER